MIRRRKEATGKYWLAYLFPAAVVVGIAYYLISVPPPISTDPRTMCPVGAGAGSVAATNLILVDRTDAVTQIEAEDIRKRLNEFAKNSVEREKFILYELGQVESVSASPLLVLCNPGGVKVDTVEEKLSHTPVSEKIFQEKFLKSLDKILEELLVIEPQPDSPIMELIQAAVVQNLKHGAANRPRRLIVVSDLMQHSRGYSHYQGLGEDAFYRSEFFEKVATDLGGIEVRVFYVKRLAGNNRQPKGHVDFWARYFQRLGGKSFVLIPVEGAAWAK